MDMKRYINKFTLAIVLGLMTLTSCSNDEWGNDNPEYQNVFIVAFADWGPKSNNDKAYSVQPAGGACTVVVRGYALV